MIAGLCPFREEPYTNEIGFLQHEKALEMTAKKPYLMYERIYCLYRLKRVSPMV